MKNAHERTCRKTKVYIYLYISPYENLFENGYIYIIYMKEFCVYCEEDTPHYMNEYGVLQCCNCEPLSESDYKSECDSSQNDPTYVPESESDSD